MKTSVIFLVFSFWLVCNTMAQQPIEPVEPTMGNNSEQSKSRIQNSIDKLAIGGYAQIDYNQPFNDSARSLGTLDVHRLVTLFGYNFNDRVNFISEIEMEHVSEVFVEQAFLECRINNFINFKGGLVLIPMGIINEIHEPPTFNGVERPNVDSKIVPTTWREVGAGFTGKFDNIGLKYQAYVVNGFNGYYYNTAKLSGKDGLRKGRQKAADSYMSSPNYSAKIEYYGMNNLTLGLAGYFGKSQSTKYEGLEKKNSELQKSADSSSVGISMVGIDVRYSFMGIKLRGQYIYTGISNSKEYNEFSGKDLGSAMQGYYLELAYNIFEKSEKTQLELLPFIRFENYTTHLNTEGDLEVNKSYDVVEVIGGLGLKVAPGAIIKADVQFTKSGDTDKFSTIFNAGVGVWF